MLSCEEHQVWQGHYLYQLSTRYDYDCQQTVNSFIEVSLLFLFYCSDYDGAWILAQSGFSCRLFHIMGSVQSLPTTHVL